jgi:hypothetical protein
MLCRINLNHKTVHVIDDNFQNFGQSIQGRIESSILCWMQKSLEITQKIVPQADIERGGEEFCDSCYEENNGAPQLSKLQGHTKHVPSGSATKEV